MCSSPIRLKAGRIRLCASPIRLNDGRPPVQGGGPAGKFGLTKGVGQSPDLKQLVVPLRDFEKRNRNTCRVFRLRRRRIHMTQDHDLEFGLHRPAVPRCENAKLPKNLRLQVSDRKRWHSSSQILPAVQPLHALIALQARSRSNCCSHGCAWSVAANRCGGHQGRREEAGPGAPLGSRSDDGGGPTSEGAAAAVVLEKGRYSKNRTADVASGVRPGGSASRAYPRGLRFGCRAAVPGCPWQRRRPLPRRNRCFRSRP